MKTHLRSLLWGLLFLFQYALIYAQTDENRLVVPLTDCAVGTTSQVAIEMTNAAEIVAAQFDMYIPTGVHIALASTDDIKLTDRKNGHVLAVKDQGAGRYTLVITSGQNNALRGNKGELVTLQLSIDKEAEIDSQHSLKLSNIVLSDKNGQNVASEKETSGILHLMTNDRPDITVQQISVTPTALSPGDQVVIQWQVANIGQLPTKDAFKEQLYLVNPTTEDEYYLGELTFTDLIANGATVSRSATYTLKKQLGIDGAVFPKIKLRPYPDLGEFAADAANNEVTGSTSLTIAQTLELSMPTDLQEKVTTANACILYRSGSVKEAETFTLTNNNAKRLSVPASVTIEEGSAAVRFTIRTINNETVDADSTALITITGNDYPEMKQLIWIADDEVPALTAQVDKETIVEGEQVVLTVTRHENLTKNPLTVKLACDHSARFTYPKEVVIPAGEVSAQVTLASVDNDQPNFSDEVVFTLSAPGYTGTNAFVTLQDNDIPDIELTIDPTILSESSGPQAAIATLKRTKVTNNKITVKLTDTAEGSLYYPSSSIVLEKGMTEYKFSIGVKDDSRKQGDRKVKLTAAVYVSSCSCSTAGTNAGTVEKELTLLDDDSESLKLTTSQTTLLEGKENATTLTITRNTSTDVPLQVTLACDKPEEVTFNPSVTIPVGQSSVEVPVSVKKNDTTEGNRTITFTVSADGFSSGVCWAMITDQTLPDATVSVVPTSRDLSTKGEVTLDLTVKNVGAAALPAQTKVEVYLSNKSLLNSASDKTLLGTYYTQTAIAPNGEELIHKTAALPDKTGAYYVVATINAAQTVKELNYVNNDSEGVSVSLESLYKVQVSTDKSTYKPGESIVITGQAHGGAVAGVPVDLYVIWEGQRTVMEVTTDQSGTFQKRFTPADYQIGHLSFGACYPGEGLKEEMSGVDVLGLKKASNSMITWEVFANEKKSGSIKLSNPGNNVLSNIKAEIVSQPQNCQIVFSSISSLSENGTADLQYEVTGTAESPGVDWEKIKVQVTSAEGAALDLDIYYYCRSYNAQLEVSESNINTSMTIGVSRDYPVTITNTGKGETGEISVVLPNTDWLSLASSAKMPSLKYGESATILLQLTPSANMQTNVTHTGQFAINCANGNGVPVSYRIMPVSSQLGTLVVDVCDEYSFYTSEKPRVAGAKVRVTLPNTNTVVAEGITDATGLFTKELTAGYYTLEVTADNHDSYRNTIMVDPGKENKEEVFLSFKAISYSWEVEETAIEDRYELVTTVVYETQVPAPVVVVSLPKDLTIEEQVFPITVVNKGLIKALDVTLELPDVSGVNLELLSDPVIPELLPNQSEIYYVKMSFSSLKASSSKAESCISIGAKALYHYLCGGYDNYRNEVARKGWGNCMAGSVGTGGSSGASGGSSSIFGPSSPPGSRKVNSTVVDDNGVIHRTIIQNCDQCLNQLRNKVIDCALGFIPGFGCGWGIGQCANSIMDGKVTFYDVTGCIYAIMGCLPSSYPVSAAINAAACLTSFAEPCLQYGPEIRSARANYPSFVIEFQTNTVLVKDALDACNSFFTILLGTGDWSGCTSEELGVLMSFLSGMENGQLLDKADPALQKCRPQSVTVSDFDLFIDRINNTVRMEKGIDANEDNYIDVDLLIRQGDLIDEKDQAAKNMGYKGLNDLWETEYGKFREKLDDASTSVCATITLQFSQSMVMTRQAFRGTLTVNNGHESVAMQNVKLNLEVSDEDGLVATSHEFQINPESIQGFDGELDGAWTLEAQQTGKATVLFIPTKYAAPTEPKRYTFGGTLSYVDPFTGLEVTRNLFPVTLTVNPSPNLKMTYFMQRDLLGDDPLTKEVEAVEPAEFSLLIHNIGDGDGTNIRMTTQQPKIVENEKGLAVEFRMIGSSLNGEDKVLPLSSDGSAYTEFGTIPAGQTSYAQWWFTSSLLGHFVDYDVKATHVTSYGNPDLSLLDEVTIKELIRSIKYPVEETTLTGFVVNETSDANDLPDHIYLSDGTDEEVYVTSNATCTGDNTQYRLIVNPVQAGWNYGSLNDPTGGHQKLISVRRVSDGAEISLRNVWLTDLTLRDGKDPLYENRLHFVDRFATTGQQEYILTFEPRPATYLKVASIVGAPTETANEPVTELTVTFNKAIDPTTFTVEDLELTCQGTKVDVTGIRISPVGEDHQVFQLDLTEVTKEKDGFFVLTVQTAEIVDIEQFKGETGEQACWNQYIGGQVILTFQVSPEEAGTINQKTGSFDHNASVVLQATPAKGYRFRSWTINGEVITTEASYTYTAIGSKTLVANFDPLNYMITIKCDPAEGILEKGATGSYPYKETVLLEAAPTAGYAFAGWKEDGKILSKNNPYLYTVQGESTVEAIFTPVNLSTVTELKSGWNWISVNTADVKDPKVFLQAVLDKVERFQSQTQELVHDPKLGLTGNLKELDPKVSYKLKLSGSGSIKQEGTAIMPDKMSISLHKGWNWLGYIPGQASTPNNVLKNLNASVNDEVKGQDGFAQFNGSGWIGTLQVMEPGKGYMYYAGQNTEFQYERVYATVQNLSLRSSQVSPWSYDANKYPNNMSMVAKVYHKTMVQEPGAFTVGAFVGKECRGIGQYVEGLLFLTVHGSTAGEKVTFKAYENATGETFDMQESVSFSEATVGNVSQPYSLHLNNYVTGIDPMEVDLYTYPNPVTTTLYIGGDYSQVKRVYVVSVNGAVLSVQELGSSNQIDFTSYADGYYLVGLETPTGYLYKKILKVSKSQSK